MMVTVSLGAVSEEQRGEEEYYEMNTGAFKRRQGVRRTWSRAWVLKDFKESAKNEFFVRRRE